MSKLTSFGPVVTSTGLSKHKVVGTEKPSKGARADRVHGTRLEINEHGAGDILIGCQTVSAGICQDQTKM